MYICLFFPFFSVVYSISSTYTFLYEDKDDDGGGRERERRRELIRETLLSFQRRRIKGKSRYKEGRRKNVHLHYLYLISVLNIRSLEFCDNKQSRSRIRKQTKFYSISRGEVRKGITDSNRTLYTK